MEQRIGAPLGTAALIFNFFFPFFFCGTDRKCVRVHMHNYQGSFYITSYHIIEIIGGKAAI